MLMTDLLLVPTRQHNEISCSTAKKNCAVHFGVNDVTETNFVVKTMSGQRGIDFENSKTVWSGLFVHPCPLFTTQELRCHLSNPKAT